MFESRVEINGEQTRPSGDLYTQLLNANYSKYDLDALSSGSPELHRLGCVLDDRGSNAHQFENKELEERNLSAMDIPKAGSMLC